MASRRVQQRNRKLGRNRLSPRRGNTRRRESFLLFLECQPVVIKKTKESMAKKNLTITTHHSAVHRTGVKVAKKAARS